MQYSRDLMPNRVNTPDRRRFIKVAASAAGFTLAIRLPGVSAFQSAGSSAFEPSAYLRIGSDDTITFWITRMEMGQGVRTLFPAMIAEELEVDLAKLHLEQAERGGKFKDIPVHTSGSGSSSGAYRRLRTAGAAAREMLVSAAAAEWNADAITCRAENGAVIHTTTNRRRTYGQLAAAASTPTDVRRITTCVDCGIALNPSGVTSQTESSIACFA